MSNVQTFREIVDDKVKNVVARFGIKDFDKNKPVIEYFNYSDLLSMIEQLEISFSLPRASVVTAIYKRKIEPKNFGDMTFEEITNIIRNKIGLSRQAAHNMQTLINYKNGIVR